MSSKKVPNNNKTLNLEKNILKQRENIRFDLCGDSNDYRAYLTDFKSMHINSFENFLQLQTPKDQRKKQGLEELLQMYFPIYQSKSGITISYVSYEIIKSQFSPRESILRNANYSYILKILIDIKHDNPATLPSQEWVIAGEIPAMTSDAIFIINGHMRIFVMELQKCPGVVFTREDDALLKGYHVNIAKLYPQHGAWLHFKLDRKGISVSVDKKTKISIIIMLMCFPKNGIYNQYTNESEIANNSYNVKEILEQFYEKTTLRISGDYIYYKIKLNKYQYTALPHDIYDLEFNKIYAKNTKILDLKEDKEIEICCPIADISNLYLAEDVVVNNTTIYLSRPISELKQNELKLLKTLDIYVNNDDNTPYLLANFSEEFSSRHSPSDLFAYNCELTRENALKILSRHWKISAYHNILALANIFEKRFFDRKYYDLGDVGRLQLNMALGINKTELFLTFDDIVGTIKNLIKLEFGQMKPDNIDSLKKKIAYSCYDILYDFMRTNLGKFRESVADRVYNFAQAKSFGLLLNASTITNGLTNHIMNFSHLYNDLNYIATMSQHSKIDSGSKTNGPERAPTSKRDIHYSQLGRICTTQTTEGKNVGLSLYLTAFCKIDTKYGFLLTPYHRVIDGVVQEDVVYLNSFEDEKMIIGDVSLYKFENGRLVHTQEYLLSLCEGNIIESHYTDIQLVMIAPNQMNSLATSLVARIETNDVYRSMVGANMHLQSMPTINNESPMLSTGMDYALGNHILAPESGKVIRVDMNRIIISDKDGNLHKIELAINKKTNTNTACTYRSLVNIDDEVKKGDLIADGFTTRDGELAIGHNVMVMFTSDKYTYEDSAKISQGLIQKNIFTSIRKSVYICNVQDTRLGTEILTKNIPGANSNDTKNLDESGIIHIGAKVVAGDILVGKMTPQSPKADADGNETKLIKMLLNDADTNYKDTSLRVPPCLTGTVIDIEVLTSNSGAKDSRTLMYDKIKLDEIENNTKELISILNNNYLSKFKAVCKTAKIDIVNLENILNTFKIKQLEKKISAYCENINFKNVYDNYIKQRQIIEDEYNEKSADINVSYDTPEGFVKIIRVYIMEQHAPAIGDKISGRCANKNVIVDISPECDMPYLSDGTPIDICLSSMGVVARMNNAQIYEAFIGYAIYELRKKFGQILRDIKYNDVKISTIREYVNELIDYATGAYNGLICKLEPKENAEKYFNGIERAYKYSDDDALLLVKKFFEKGIFVKMEQFKSYTSEEFEKLLTKLGSVKCEKQYVYNGQTGERSYSKVTVGYLYVMALHHTAHSKMHARSMGPISTMSLQPVYGKSRAGGQRFGEMEAWAEGAKGCSNILQEMFNAKSDSISQKNAIVKQIINNGHASLGSLHNEVSEGFRNLAAYLMACGIEIQLLDNSGNVIPNWFHVNLDKPEYINAKARIIIMAPERVMEISQGEVKNSETLNFKSSEPVKDGLCDMSIFGSNKDYQCKCGEMRGRKNEGLRCPKCKVLIANSLIRRENFGHIVLSKAMVHPLFYRNSNNMISYLLGLPNKAVNDIISLESYIITGIGEEIHKNDGSIYKEGDFVSSEEYERIKKVMQLRRIIDFEFEAVTGGDAIKYLLENIDLNENLKNLKQQLTKSSSMETKINIAENIMFIKNIIDRKVPLKGLILENLLIAPANLRPIVELSPGSFAASDLNYLYKEIIVRNEHLKDMMNVFVDLMKTYQEKLLAESISHCIGAHGSTYGTKNNTGKVHKSILEMIGGKEGLLRRTLLGKRVDFSGRAVIVTAPTTQLDECYIPDEMALEIFKPHIIHYLLKNGVVNSSRAAIEIIKLKKSIVFEALDKIVSNTLVGLNRAPTLHRVSIMYFKARLWKHNTIGLNPLTCLAYNADFDGDQMAIHIPLSNEAIAEAYMLGRPSSNIGSAAHGGFIVGAFKDMILGIYILTSIKESNNIKTFYNIEDAFMAYENKEIDILEAINIIMPTNMIANVNDRMIKTSIGRLIFMKIVPDTVLKIINLNKQIDKKDIQLILSTIRNEIDDQSLVVFINKVQMLGFKYAGYFSASFGLEDFINIKEVKTIIKQARAKRIQVSQQFTSGFISHREFDKKCMDLSLEVNSKIGKLIATFAQENQFNPIIQIVLSGARSKLESLTQLYGAKGNPVSQNGTISPMMIFNNHADGMTQLEYYSLSFAARKGVLTVALSTAEAGYLTRKLVDIAHSCVIAETSCGTTEYILAKNSYYNGKLLYSIYDQILGRTLARSITIGTFTIPVGTLLCSKEIDLLKKYNIQEVYIYSPVLCYLLDGICRQCYGADLSTMKPVPRGYAAGIIAAQSMGEPSTQLTMVKNVAIFTMLLAVTKIITPAKGCLKFKNENYITSLDGKIINISRNMLAIISNEHNQTIASISVPYGAEILLKSDTIIEANSTIALTQTDMPFISHFNGRIIIEKLFEGINYEKMTDEKNNNCIFIRSHSIMPVAKIVNNKGEILQQMFFPKDTIILIPNESEVNCGLMVGYIRKVQSGINISTGGLQHITNILENRNPGDVASIAPFSGTLKFKQTLKKNIISLVDDAGVEVILPRVDISNCLYSHDNKVNKGDVLSSGSLIMQEIVDYQGINALIDYFVKELQSVYISHGLVVNDKHFELILSQMIRMNIVTNGDYIGQIMHKVDIFQKIVMKDKFSENTKAFDSKTRNILNNNTKTKVNGVTRGALSAISPLSQISFQMAASGIAEHAIRGSIDPLTCYKSSIIVGKQPPSIGTGRIKKEIMQKIANKKDGNKVVENITESTIDNLILSETSLNKDETSGLI